jgi:hypothetical protein
MIEVGPGPSSRVACLVPKEVPMDGDTPPDSKRALIGAY